jgi:hypothetical protein
MKKWIIAAALIAVVWIGLAACTTRKAAPIIQAPAIEIVQPAPLPKQRPVQHKVRPVQRKIVAPAPRCQFLFWEAECPR